jgi:hypothetical protein
VKKGGERLGGEKKRRGEARDYFKFEGDGKRGKATNLTEEGRETTRDMISLYPPPFYCKTPKLGI